MNNEFPGMEVVGKATSGAEAKLLAGETKPDILLLDLALSGSPCLLPSLVNEEKFHIIILCDYHDEAAIDEVVLEGVRGVVQKEEPIQTILKAIEKSA